MLGRFKICCVFGWLDPLAPIDPYIDLLMGELSIELLLLLLLPPFLETMILILSRGNTVRGFPTLLQPTSVYVELVFSTPMLKRLSYTNRLETITWYNDNESFHPLQ